MMARKSALVVDDSKSARVILSRILEKYDLEVDMAESAEQAIAYLNSNRPDAIFMDHNMPGMDGLQAVQAIKSNPQTATIPIMMYTSQEGELYVGQARALGALGVLPKQVRAVDVSKVLHELHLLPDRRDLAETAPATMTLGGATSEPAATATAVGASQAIAAGPDAHAGAAHIAGGPDWVRRLETTVRDQAADIRRLVVASLNGFAARIVDDLRAAGPAPAIAAPAAAPAPESADPPPARPWGTAVPAMVVAAVCAVAWLITHGELTKARAAAAAFESANADLQRSNQELGAAVKDLTAALAAATTLSAAAPANGLVTPRIEPVPYGEIPFARSRLETLREFLARLEAQGFRGVVKITSSAGMFCLSANPIDGYAPATPSLPASKCDLVGNPFDDSLTVQQRQSIDFANLVNGIRQRTAAAISVVIDNAGNTRPAVPYPQRTEALTAGEWNHAAALNNRVEFAAEPASSGP
jgi:CheY-like chemotaxis protein